MGMVKFIPGKNDLATTCPEIAKEANGWDPKKIYKGSTDRKEWKCIHGHTWSVKVTDRVSYKTGCPYCAGNKAWPGFNDLQTKYPEIAKEAYGWDPSQYLPGSHHRGPWQCKLGHTFEAQIKDRVQSQTKCPICACRKLLIGFNDLKSRHPELAAEADGWDPSQVLKGSNKKLPWKCKLGHKWEAKIISRVTDNSSCPYCSGHSVWPGFNDLLTTHPELAKEAYGWDPKKYSSGSNKKVKWIHLKNHIWESTILNRVSANSGCPYCHGTKVLAGFNDLATTHPAIAKEADNWDPTSVTAGSNTKKKWVCLNGHKSFSQVVVNRTIQSAGCPRCAEHGYNPGKAGWMYLMNRPGEQQFGISNIIEDRVKQHARKGWVEIDRKGPINGQSCWDLEISIKSWLKDNYGNIPGTTENWLTKDMELQSLSELFERSGTKPFWEKISGQEIS